MNLIFVSVNTERTNILQQVVSPKKMPTQKTQFMLITHPTLIPSSMSVGAT